MQKTYIYTLEDPITGQIRYVGKANDMKKRLGNHINSGRDKGTHKRNWIEKLKRQGFRPIMRELDCVNIDEWQYWEKYWHNQLITWGFNLLNETTGGDGLTFGNATSFKKGHGARKVTALNRDGSFYKSYQSLSEASADVKIDLSGISRVLTGKTKTSGSFIWLYTEEYEEKTDEEIQEIVEYTSDYSTKGGKETQFKKGDVPWNRGKTFKRKGKTVLQLDKQGVILNEYPSCAEAARQVKGNQDAISNCCRGKQKTSAGFKWMYKEN